MTTKVLLGCGVVAALAYLGTDITAAAGYAGYSYVNQAVSELTAIGSPVRDFAVSLFTVHGVLQLAFGIGIWLAAGQRHNLRLVGAMMMAIGVLDLFAYFAPMHVRGSEVTFSDTMHIVLTVATVALILGAIGFGAVALGPRFRLFSFATLAVVILFGTAAGAQGSRVAAGLPTPWFGLLERANIYGYMLWMAVLAVTLLRGDNGRPARR